MKKFFGSLLILLALCTMVNAQTPTVQWEKKLYKKLYESDGQLIYGMTRINNGGFVFVGTDTGSGFNKNSYLDRQRITYAIHGMLIKTDTSGNLIWGKKENENYAFTSVVNSGNNIVAAGMSSSSNGGNSNFLITKYNLNGSLVWQKLFGGSDDDYCQSIAIAHDSGYVVAGSTHSNDGNVSGKNGAEDFWVLKLGETGNLLWQKCFGGSGHDRAYSIQPTLDGGYIIAGGDSTSGRFNGLIIKIDGGGNLLWQKSYGGTGRDMLKTIIPLTDGGYLAVGHSNSNDGDITGNHGSSDVWVLKMDATGNKVWSKCYGGSNEEYGSAAEATEDGGFLITGHTASNNGDVTDLKGGDDIWLVKIDVNGNLIWQKTIGGTINEYGAAVTTLSENVVYVTGNKYNPSTDFNRTTAHFYKLGNSNTIKGRVFLDNNLNGSKDANEPYMSNQVVQTQKQGGYTRSAITNNGAFSIDVDTGTYQTSVLYNSTYYTVTPTSTNSVFSTYFNTDSLNFALQPIPGIKDLVVNLMGLTPVRPGFDASYKIFYKNQGTEAIASGTVQWVKSNKLNFVSASPAQSSQTGDTLRWNFTDFDPQDSASIIIHCTVAAPPATNNGDVLRSVATILPVTGDITPADDTSRLAQTVTGSYDPNDKKEVHDGKIKPEQVAAGEWLQYTIRFQNTGTDTAFNVKVRDTLSNKVDLSTLQMVSASHSYALNIKDGNKLTWTFSNIKLVDSVRNEPLSHGYIVYRIKPLPTLAEGDIILNSASIYFDFNLPVITNEEETHVLSEVLPVHLLSFTAQKRGDKNILQWRSATEANASHFDMERSNDGKDYKKIGKVAANGSPGNYSFTDENPFRELNYYRLKMVDKDGTHAYSAIRIVNNAEGISGLSLFPNPVKDAVTVKIFSDKTKTIQVDIVNAEGKMIQSQKIGLNEGANTRTLNLVNLPKGTYFARVNTGTGQVAVKFEKL